MVVSCEKMTLTILAGMIAMNKTAMPVKICSVALKVILKCIVVFTLSRIKVVFISLSFFVLLLSNIYCYRMLAIVSHQYTYG